MLFYVGEYLTLTVLYSLIIYSMVEALIRLWSIREPRVILRFRLLVLALPPLCAAFVTLFFQDRSSFLVAYNLILFESEKWFRLFDDDGVIVWSIFFVIAVGSGIIFYSQTILPIWSRRTHGKQLGTIQAAYFPKVSNVLLVLSQLFPSLPGVFVVDEDRPVAYVAGIRNLAIFVSKELIELLDEEELAAVLVHEIAHIRKGDMILSWIIFLLRALTFYNPVATITFNQISLEMEQSCDEEVAVLTQKRLAFASALLKVHRATAPTNVESSGSDLQSKVSFRLAAWGVHARWSFTEGRVKRILTFVPGNETKYAKLRFILLMVCAVIVMLFVT